MIFDGNVIVHSTCRACGEQMQVIDPDEPQHPTCEPRPTKMESLAAGWLSTVLAGDVQAEKFTAADIEKLEAEPPNLLKAALWYSRWGWPVFPLRGRNTNCEGGTTCNPVCECPKKPATRNGFKDATTDVGQIRAWWTRNPDYNIGAPTGHLFDVFDVDTQHGGLHPFLDLIAQKRIPQVHGVVCASKGGMHLYLEPKGIGNKAGFKQGLDYRGIGGYVVMPPSVLNDQPGRSWSWMVAPSPTIKALQSKAA